LHLTLGADVLVPSVALGGNNAFHLECCLDRCAMRPGVSLKPSLFTRPSVVEDELSAVKGMLAELQVSQDELRRDRDE
jgi:hypothetical protein